MMRYMDDKVDENLEDAKWGAQIIVVIVWCLLKFNHVFLVPGRDCVYFMTSDFVTGHVIVSLKKY